MFASEMEVKFKVTVAKTSNYICSVKKYTLAMRLCRLFENTLCKSRAVQISIRFRAHKYIHARTCVY